MDNQTFTTPYDVVELPSKGRLYNNCEPTVKVEYLTAADENILTSPNLMVSGRGLDMLVERKVKDLKIKTSDMLSGDKDAILLFLRSTGYGEIYPVELTDPNTGRSFNYDFDLSTIKIKGLGAEPDEQGEFSLDLPSGNNVKLRLLTIAEENVLVERDESYRAKTNGEVSNILTYRLEAQVQEFSGERDKGNIGMYINSRMSALDSLTIRRYINEITPGIDRNIEIQAPSGEMIKTVLPINSNFFWPNS